MNTHAQDAPRHAAIIGGGPAGLMAAEAIASRGVRVTIYDRMPSLARKFLLAGRGGLNLTHSEPFDAFVARYGAAADRLRPALEAFAPQDLIAWCEGLGEATFIGSSGRVFPKGFKASPLLRLWLRRLAGQGVEVRLRISPAAPATTWRRSRSSMDAAGRLERRAPPAPSPSRHQSPAAATRRRRARG